MTPTTHAALMPTPRHARGTEGQESGIEPARDTRGVAQTNPTFLQVNTDIQGGPFPDRGAAVGATVFPEHPWACDIE